MEATPKRTRLSYKDKAAIVEAARKGGGKEAMRDKMMSEYKISRSAYYAIFRDFVYFVTGYRGHRVANSSLLL